MSKNPKIYGFCDAGCRWETVHMVDFQRSASIVACNKMDGKFYLEGGKLYKIKKATEIENSAYGFYFTVVYGIGFVDREETIESSPITISHDGANRSSLLARLVRTYVDGSWIKGVFEIDGTIQTYDLGYHEGFEAFIGVYQLVVNNSEGCSVDECYMVNENAEILAKTAYDYAVDGGYTGSEEEFSRDMMVKLSATTAYEFAKNGGYTGTEEEFAQDMNPESIKAEATPVKGVDYFDGAKGEKGDRGERGETGSNYTLTDSDKTEIAEQVDGATLAQSPLIVTSQERMIDTSRLYVLSETGTIWAYKDATPDAVMATGDNPCHNDYQLGSDGNTAAASAYVTSPYIDLSQYSGTITLTFGKKSGASWITEAPTNKIRVGLYDENKTKIYVYMAAQSGTSHWPLAETNSVILPSLYQTITIPLPYVTLGQTVRYIRFATEVNEWIDADITVTAGEVGWFDTGMKYAYFEEEPKNYPEFTLANPAVRAFEADEAYDSTDYAYTNVNNHTSTECYRKDLPFPVQLRWNRVDNAAQYTVTLNQDRHIIVAGIQTYYTDDDKISIYNLIPNTTYYYRVCALTVDGEKVIVKDGSFTTAADRARLLRIDGAQNARDIGGYTNIRGYKVKYGLLFRGSAVDEDYRNILRVSADGGYELTNRVGVRTDIDLRGDRTESVLVANTPSETSYKAFAYYDYALAIETDYQRTLFKEIFEYIVERLDRNRPIYIHCQGGCDRTGTLVTLLLGLLWVSESDLAKEYELSSFSAIGRKTRTRNSETYKYKDMITAIKTYTENTSINGESVTTDIAYNIEAFARACGIADATVTQFRLLMLDGFSAG